MRLVLIVFSLVVVQFSFFSSSASPFLHPDLLLLFLCYCSSYTGVRAATLLGVILGFIQGSFSFLPSLGYSLAYGLIGFILGSVSKGVLREAGATQFLFAFLGLGIKWFHVSCLAFFLYQMRWSSAATVLQERALPELMATLITAPFLFALFNLILIRKRRYHFVG